MSAPIGFDLTLILITEVLPGINRWDEVHSVTLRMAKNHYETRSTLYTMHIERTYLRPPSGRKATLRVTLTGPQTS